MKKRLAAVAAVFIAALTFGASPAHAYTDNLSCHSYGGKIYLNGDSFMKDDALYIYASGCGHGWLPLGRWSSSYYNFRDTDAFWVPRAHRCKSQWGYYYEGGNDGRWFWLNNDSVVLYLDCNFTPPW